VETKARTKSQSAKNSNIITTIGKKRKEKKTKQNKKLDGC
jgi:hypothetical protein